MSQGAIIAGAFILVVVCCSSSSAMLMMGGDEEKTTPTTTTGPGPAGPAPPTGPVMLKCINTSRRGEMGWVRAGVVKTEAEARQLCVGKKYMSLECPTANGFEVWCTDDISLADTLLEKECKGDVTGTSLHNGTNVHCVGPYKWGDVNGGGANRGALYTI
jgi:hypothetical protein